MNLNMELQTFKKEINTLSNKLEKILVQVEKLEKSKLDVEIFDFKKNWHLVEPHLNDPYILSLLDDGMQRYCMLNKLPSLPDWDRKNGIGPWAYSCGDFHSREIEDKMNEDPENLILNEKYYDIYEKMGLDFCKDRHLLLDDIKFLNDNPQFKVKRFSMKLKLAQNAI